MNSSVKGKDLSQEELLQLVSEIFSILEILTKDREEQEVKVWADHKLYPIELLKYSTTNEQDKSSIIKFISNAFNIDVKDVYRIKESFEDKLYGDKDNLDKDSKEFLEAGMDIMLPNMSKSVSIIMDGKESVKKSEEYIKLYFVSLLAIKYRASYESEDKRLLKSQYESMAREFNEKVEEYVITAGKLGEKIRIDNSFSISIDQISKEITDTLSSVELKEDDEVEVDNFENGLREQFFQEVSSVSEEVVLEDSYIEEQIAELASRYDERYRIIIQEYFTRSAKVYGWTKDEFDKKVRNYLQNIRKIEFVKNMKIKGRFVAGAFDIKKEKIYIEDELFFTPGYDALDIFFHEQGHATDVVIRNGKTEFENGLIYNFNSINEYATEIGSIHLLGDKVYEDKLCFTHKISGGYYRMKYAGSMMAAALGISEFDFAKLRDKEDKEFSRSFKEKFSYLDIEEELRLFNDILNNIDNAPEILYMQQLSESYANMYNMANRIIQARLTHEKNIILPENQEAFELKSKYEMTKIAINMNLARRKLHLRDKYIRPIMEDDTMLANYSNITSEDRKQYLTLVERLYPEKNIRFDNRVILRHIKREFKYPIRRKISKLFKRKNVPMLNTLSIEGSGEEDLSDRCRKFREGCKENTKLPGGISERNIEKKGTNLIISKEEPGGHEEPE